MNIRELLEKTVSQFPKKIFLCFGEKEVSFSEFDNLINRLSNGFLSVGVQKGDKVCIMLQNCPEFLYCWFALNKIGAILVPVNIGFKKEEAKYIFNHSEAKVVIISPAYLDLVKEIKRDCENLENIFVIGPIGTDLPKNFIELGEFQKRFSEKLAWVDIVDDDDAVYIYTSGTTGLPKGVMLTHRSYVLIGQSFAWMIKASCEDRIMTPNPLFHANAQVYSTMGSLAVGASLILIEKFSASKLWDQTRKYCPTKLVLVGPATPMVWRQPRRDLDKQNTVETLVAGYVPVEYYSEFEERFGLTVQTIFSLTESPMCIMGPREGLRKPGSVGVPMSHPDPLIRNEAKIVDREGNEVPPGEKGEIIVKNPAVMKGYYKEPRKTLETLRSGWVYTGDIGYKDEDGYFFFVGREKDIIRKKGENISAAEVESVINKHPDVLECAVIAVPSELGHGDDEIKAFIVPTNPQLQPQEIIDWCTDKLADFKIPRFVEFRPNLPKTALGKMMKEDLKGSRGK